MSCFLKKYPISQRRAVFGILMIGIPAGIQNAIFAIANLFVQAGVNSFDTIMVSGSAAATNADTLIFNVMYAFYTGMFQFHESELRCQKQKKSAQKLFYQSVLFFLLPADPSGSAAVCFWSSVPFICLPLTRQSSMPACRGSRIMAFSYAVSAFMDCTIAASRGIGKTIVPTIIITPGFLCIPYRMDLHRSLPGFIPFRHFICCMFFRGLSLQPQKSFILYIRKLFFIFCFDKLSQMLNYYHFLKFSLFFYCFY